MVHINDISFKDYWRYNRKLTPTESSWFDFYLRKFKRLALNVYKWEEVPDGVDPYLIEKYLFEDGRCMIYNSKEFGLVVARAMVTQWDAWKKPLMLRPVFDGIPQVMEEVPIDECCYITDLYDMDGAKRRDCFILISNLIEIQNVIDTQNTNQATPLMAIGGNIKTKDKLRNCIHAISNGYKVMFLEDDISNSLKPLNLNSPFNVPTLVQYKKEIENEILSYLGIDSQQAFQKKERMIVDEQEGNDELLNYFLADGLKARQMAIDNNKIGFNPVVSIQEFIRPEMVEDDVNDNKGVDVNEKTD